MTPVMRVIGSGSSGNGYFIRTDSGILLLELGMKWRDIMSSLSYNISDMCGALVSHRHFDHSKSIQEALIYRIPVYSCRDVAERFRGVAPLESGRKYRMGPFTVQPIPVRHNAENYAYLIEHDDFGRLLFATDLIDFPYKIGGLNTVMIEANYSEEIVLDNMCRNEASFSSPENHMEINETLSVLERLKSPDLQTVVLLHLSSGNSDERKFRRLVMEALPGVDVYVADKGLEIELRKEEF